MLFKKNDYTFISIFLKKKLNLNLSLKHIKLLTKFLNCEHKNMMLCCKTNKSISQKKNLYFNFLKFNDVFSLSILNAYTIYFITISSLLEKIKNMNSDIRINNAYDDKKIENYFKICNNLKLNNINYENFFLKKEDSIISNFITDN